MLATTKQGDACEVGDEGVVEGPCSNPALKDERLMVMFKSTGKVANAHTSQIRRPDLTSSALRDLAYLAVDSRRITNASSE
jgi:hypothetical protein